MSTMKAPRSLRSGSIPFAANTHSEFDTAKKVTAVCLAAAGTIGTAEAQQASPLPSITVEAPVARPRPAAPRPTQAQLNARAAMRRRARQARPVQAPPAATPGPSAALPAFARLPDGNPYADPAAPYKADRLASSKFTEPLLNTPRTVTVLTKEVLEDKNATTLRDIARTTAGVTLGTGEGGNAFGDRFFIRGFDARNDIFVDGVRDPGVSIRENFFTEQVEILRGPASSFAGRGTTGGAINIVTKSATTDKDFYKAEGTVGTASLGRVTFDINKVISPGLAVRLDGMAQTADVAARNYVYDDRWGLAGSVLMKPIDNLKITANYVHTDLSALPDFGVPYNSTAQKPFTELGVDRATFYGFVNRDFQKTRQDLGTLDAEYKVNDWLTVSNKTRLERSVLNYIGTIPESPSLPTLTFTANPQSRYQTANVIANQTDATFKFDTGPIKHTAVVGTEFSHERVSIDSYTGLTSETLGTGAFTSSGSLSGQSIYNPSYNLLPFANGPGRAHNPTVVPVDTKAVYAIETANYNDFVILNGGVRYDDYDISSTKGNSTVSASSGLVNYNAGITVKPLPYASVYAAFATSSDPVGSELDANSVAYGGLSPTPANNINQVFGPVRNKAYEVGTKWELFDRHLLATAALFRTEQSNARDTIPSGQPNAGQNVPGAEYHVQGIDLGAGGKITERWSVFSGLVLMESKVDKSIVAASVGQQLANIAHQSFNVLTKYQITDWLELGGQATYMSKIYGGTLAAGVPYTVLPPHWRFDAFAEAKINQNFTIKFFVENIFDKRYYDAFYRSAAPFVFIAPGRSASVVLTAKF